MQGPSVTSASPPPLALSETVAGSGQAVKEKGRANLPMPGECPSEVLGMGRESQGEAGPQTRAGHEQDIFRAWGLEARVEERLAFNGAHS